MHWWDVRFDDAARTVYALQAASADEASLFARILAWQATGVWYRVEVSQRGMA